MSSLNNLNLTEPNQIHQVFQLNGIDMEVLLYLSKDDMLNCGIKLGDVLKILNGIKEMNESKNQEQKPEPSPIDTMGWIEKKGGGTAVFGRKNWNRRYMNLENCVLSWYQDEQKTKGKPKNTLALTAMSTIELVPAEDERKHCFCVRTEQRTLIMNTTKSGEKMQWMKALISHIELAKWKAENQSVFSLEKKNFTKSNFQKLIFLEFIN